MFYILLLFFLLGSTYCTTYGDVSGGTCANSGYFDCCGDASHAVISANSVSWVACGDNGWPVGCGDSHFESPHPSVDEFTEVFLTLNHFTLNNVVVCNIAPSLNHQRRRLECSQW